jgi:hypothetical protein
MKNWIDRMAFTSHGRVFRKTCNCLHHLRYRFVKTTRLINEHRLGTWGIKITRRMRFRLGALFDPRRFGSGMAIQSINAKQFLDALHPAALHPSSFR